MANERENGATNKITDCLDDDVQIALSNQVKDDTQFNRRALVRTIFASLEASIFSLKQRILSPDYSLKFDNGDIPLLREETFTLDGKGRPQSQAKYLPFDQNFRYAISAYARLFKVDVSMDCGGNDWHEFKEAIKVRNRITHPKDVNSCSISVEELKCVGRAYVWAFSLINQCYEGWIAKIEAGDRSLLHSDDPVLQYAYATAALNGVDG